MRYEQISQFIRDTFSVPEGPLALHEPRFYGKEKEYVADCIDSTFVSSVGRYVTRFEEMMKEYTGAAYAVATVNGTAALHIALQLAGVRQGDLVITQPLTFIATCNAIAYTGAEPLFTDIDRDTLGLSPAALKAFLDAEAERTDAGCRLKDGGRRIAACVPMHTFGHPARIREICEICDAYGIPVVEDAAESVGSTSGGLHTGRFGQSGTMSFNGNKTITCGGGGMIITDNEDLGKMAKHLTTQAKVPHPWEFIHDHTGYNYRLPNLNAAMACAQMEQLPLFLERKRALAAKYRSFFAGSGIQYVDQPEGTVSNFWLNAILLENRSERDRFLEHTNGSGIMTRPAWTLMNKLPMYSHCICGPLDNAVFIEDRLVNIPSSVIL